METESGGFQIRCHCRWAALEDLEPAVEQEAATQGSLYQADWNRQGAMEVVQTD